MHRPPEFEQEGHHLAEEPVSIADQVEGKLLSMGEEEISAHVLRGQDRFLNVLEKAAVEPENYTAEMIAIWIRTDPNMLLSPVIQNLSDKEKARLPYFLWGALGKTGISVPLDSSGNHRYSTTALYLLRDSKITNHLRYNLIFAPDKTLFHDRYVLEELQQTAMIAEIQDDPITATKWIEECRTNGREDFALACVRDYLWKGGDREVIQKMFPWFPQKIDPQLQKLTVEERLQSFEEQDHAARVSHEFRAKKQRNDDPWLDFDGTEEEEEMTQPPHASRPMAQIGSHRMDAVEQPKKPVSDLETAIAIVRFVRMHPDATKPFPSQKSSNPFLPDDDDIDEEAVHRSTEQGLVASLLATVELLPYESVPREILDYLKEKLSDPQMCNSYVLSPWRPYHVKNASQDPEKFLRGCLCNEHEHSLVKNALPKNADDSLVELEFQNAFSVKVLSHWLRAHPLYSIQSPDDFEAALSDVHAMWLQEYEDNFGSDSSQVISLTHGEKYGSSTHYNSVNASNDSGFLRPLFWMVCQKYLPLEDAALLMNTITWHRDKRGMMYKILLDRKEAHVPETGWKLWEKLKQTLDANDLASFVLDHTELFSSAFQSDPARAVEEIRSALVIPLLQEDNDRFKDDVVDLIALLARYDRTEAQELFQLALKNTHVLQRIHNSIDGFHMGAFDRKTKSIFQMCYAELSFPALEKKNYLQTSEGNPNSTMPPMLARMLDREAEIGVHFAPRLVPAMHREQLIERWYDIVGHHEYPPPTPSDAPPSEKNKESPDGAPSLEDIRDHLLENIDNEQKNETYEGDSPMLPTAPSLSDEPKVVGQLSERLNGDNRYLLTNICDSFDPAWLAHMPMEKEQKMTMRSYLHGNPADGKNVSLQMRMSYGAVVPVSMGAEIRNIKLENGRARWAAHWSKRIDTQEPTDVAMEYAVGTEHHVGANTLQEVRGVLPPTLLQKSDDLADMNDLPEVFQEFLRSLDTTSQPLSQIVRAVQNFVSANYEYCFILKNPLYKERYRALLESMPIHSSRNEYLAFIHALRDTDEQVLGRGVCGQMATVLKCALNSIGIPAYFASGYMANSTTITSNDAHAWVIVPFLDANGKIIFKPIDAAVQQAGFGEGGDVGFVEASETEEEQKEEQKGSHENAKSDDSVRERIEQLFHLPNHSLTVEDIRLASALISEANRTRKMSLPEHYDGFDSLRESATRTDPLSIETVDPKGFAFDPATRERSHQLLSSVRDDLSPGAIDLVQYVLSEGEKAYAAWENEIVSSGDLDDLLEDTIDK